MNLIEKNKSFTDMSEIVAEKLLDMLAQRFNQGHLVLGNNATDVFREKEVFYKLECSSFDDEFLYIKKSNVDFSMSYEIELVTIGNETPVNLKIGIDESLAKNKLPMAMLEKLDEEFSNFLFG